MSRTLIAKSAVKEVVVCSDVDAIDQEHHATFGALSLSDEEEAYVLEELGAEYELEVVENY